MHGFGDMRPHVQLLSLLLLGLWLFMLPAWVWGTNGGGFGQQLLEVGRISLSTLVFIVYFTFGLPFRTSHLIPNIFDQRTVYPTCHGQANDLRLQSCWRGYSRVLFGYTRCLVVVERARPGTSISRATRSASTEELVWVLGAGDRVVLGEACSVDEGGCWLGDEGVVSASTLVDFRMRLARLARFTAM